MAQSWQRFRRWLHNFFDTGPDAPSARSTPVSGKAPETGPAAARDLVSGFYAGLSREIASHRNYESEMSEGVDRDSAFVARFDPAPYAKRLVEFFRSGKLLGPAVNDGAFYAVPMVVMFPDAETRGRLGWSLRRKLFASLLRTMSDEAKLPVSELAKRYFERIHHTGLDVPGTTKQELIEGLRDVLHELEVDASIAQRTGKMPRLSEAETASFLSDLLSRLRLKKRTDVLRAIKTRSDVGAFFSMFFALFLFLAVLGAAAASAVGGAPDVVFTAPPDPLFGLSETVASVLPLLLLLIFGVGSAMAAYRLGSHWRGRSLRATLRSAVKAGLVSVDAVAKYFREKFEVEWRL
ncbi:MAG: hypothetical protein ACLFPV_15420 [Spirochaetaceae bacterium]